MTDDQKIAAVLHSEGLGTDPRRAVPTDADVGIAIDAAFTPRKRTSKELHAQQGVYVHEAIQDALETLKRDLGRAEDVDTEWIGDLCRKAIRQWEQENGMD